MDESFFKELEQRALNTAPFPDPRFPPSPYYRFLRLLAAEMRPRLSVELGVCGGGASFATGAVMEAGGAPAGGASSAAASGAARPTLTSSAVEIQ